VPSPPAATPVSRLPNAWLLYALLLLVGVYPFLQDFPIGRALIAFFDPAILALALIAARASGAEGRVGLLLVLPAIALHVFGAMGGHPGVYVASLLAQAAFHAFVVVCLLRYVLRDTVMTPDEMFAAANLYVLAAFVFAYLYTALEILQPGAFAINPANNPDGVLSWWELLYFSFTCLTSVGFGEITPVSDHGRSLVMVQQMAGVLYLTLVISRLVSMQAQRAKRPDCEL
jgi:hypothetical protein